MSDVGLFNPFFKPLTEKQQIRIMLEGINQRLSQLDEEAQIPDQIVQDLKALVGRGSKEALEIFTNILLTKQTSVPFNEKMQFLEAASSFDKDAAFYCGKIYLGLNKLNKNAMEYFNQDKAIKYLKLASYLSHNNASFILISVALQCRIKLTEQEFITLCKEMVRYGDLYAAVYCAAVLCDYRPDYLEKIENMQITKDVHLAYRFILAAIIHSNNDKELIQEIINLVKKGLKDKIWCEEDADDLRDRVITPNLRNRVITPDLTAQQEMSVSCKM